VNSRVVLEEICKHKKLVIRDIKKIPIIDLKKLIVRRLYVHKFNIGYNWLPSSMRNYNDNDNYNDWNNNSTLKTTFNGIFDKIDIHDRENTSIISVTNKEKGLNNLTITIHRHEHFEDMYAIYFNINDNNDPLFWTNLSDYKINILGIMY